MDWSSKLSKGLVLILGGPASGKTTALNYLARRAAEAGQTHLLRPNLKTSAELVETFAPASRTVVYADVEVEENCDLYEAIWKLDLNVRESLSEVIESAFGLTLIPTRNGPVLLTEVFLCRPDLRWSLAQSHSCYQLRAKVGKCQEAGMRTWIQSLVTLWQASDITTEEAIAADSYSDFIRMVDREKR